MSKEKQPKPEDQRSTVKNPNNQQHTKDRVNTEKQIKENSQKKK
jgi:hypothetical protein